MDNTGIPCKFIPIKKSAFTTEEGTKSGLYSGCFYNFYEFGITRWVICAYLDVEHKKYLDAGMKNKELIDGCLEYLNYVKEPERKSKKIQKPKYGNLEPIVSKITGEYDVKFEDERIIVQFLTDDRQNGNFWGEGIKT